MINNYEYQLNSSISSSLIDIKSSDINICNRYKSPSLELSSSIYLLNEHLIINNTFINNQNYTKSVTTYCSSILIDLTSFDDNKESIISSYRSNIVLNNVYFNNNSLW